MNRDNDPRDRSAYVGGSLFLIALFIYYAIPEPYNMIVGKAFIGLIALVIFGFLAFEVFSESLKKHKEDLRNFLIGFVAVAVVVLIVIALIPSDSSKSTPQPTSRKVSSTIPPYKTAAPRATTKVSTSSSATLITYYKMNFPMTWGYISKYADNPSEYIVFYHDVWGDLQKHHGDGIPFDTLSWYEQSLVDYPDIGAYIYFSKGGSTYHSTRDCYTLLRSETSFRSSQFASQYSPCSKCVGE